MKNYYRVMLGLAEREKINKSLNLWTINTILSHFLPLLKLLLTTLFPHTLRLKLRN
jgi:hypothetical protein